MNLWSILPKYMYLFISRTYHYTMLHTHRYSVSDFCDYYYNCSIILTLTDGYFCAKKTYQIYARREKKSLMTGKPKIIFTSCRSVGGQFCKQLLRRVQFWSSRKKVAKVLRDYPFNKMFFLFQITKEL